MKTLLAAIIILLIIHYLKSKRPQKKINVAHKTKAPKKQKNVRKEIVEEKIIVNEENIDSYFQRFKEAWKPVGNLKPECPYCGHKFEKMPQRKRKCPSCKKSFYSRTIPQKDKKSLLREEDLPILEKQYRAIADIRLYTKNDPEYETVYEDLKKEFGIEPRVHDVLSRVFNERILQTSSEGDFGLFRNAHLGAAEMFREEKNFLESLAYIFYVCYLDINGAHNNMRKKEMYGSDSISFQKRHSKLSPGVDQIKTLSTLAELTIDEQEEIYYYIVNKFGSFPYAIYSFTESWEYIKKALDEAEHD